jgi:hypothetical protein
VILDSHMHVGSFESMFGVLNRNGRLLFFGAEDAEAPA